MNLIETQRNWDELGKTDPLWAILTSPDRKGGKWDLAEFFATGRREVAEAMDRAQTLGLPARRETALDFGCGVGRLTQALCERFAHCRGVDIAPSMIELARGYNTHGDRCEYLLNAHDDLRIFSDDFFDLVYSSIALQHIEPRYSTCYIREFARILRPGGLMVFQVPDRFVPDEPSSPARQPAYEPMPDSGFRAEFTDYPDAIRAAAGTRVVVPVTVRNAGQSTWSSAGDGERHYLVQLGNHWLTPEGEPVVWDDGRQALPYDAPPGAQIQMAVTVTAPQVPGEYAVELDMVQEGVAWFKQKSSVSALVQAEVQPAAAAAAAEARALRMGMYCVAQEKVTEVLESGGARVVDIRRDEFTGPKWISYQYFATKP